MHGIPLACENQEFWAESLKGRKASSAMGLTEDQEMSRSKIAENSNGSPLGESPLRFSYAASVRQNLDIQNQKNSEVLF